MGAVPWAPAAPQGWRRGPWCPVLGSAPPPALISAPLSPPPGCRGGGKQAGAAAQAPLPRHPVPPAAPRAPWQGGCPPRGASVAGASPQLMAVEPDPAWGCLLCLPPPQGGPGPELPNPGRSWGTCCGVPSAGQGGWQRGPPVPGLSRGLPSPCLCPACAFSLCRQRDGAVPRDSCSLRLLQGFVPSLGFLIKLKANGGCLSFLRVPPALCPSPPPGDWPVSVKLLSPSPAFPPPPSRCRRPGHTLPHRRPAGGGLGPRGGSRDRFRCGAVLGGCSPRPAPTGLPSPPTGPDRAPRGAPGHPRASVPEPQHRVCSNSLPPPSAEPPRDTSHLPPPQPSAPVHPPTGPHSVLGARRETEPGFARGPGPPALLRGLP